MDIFLVEDNLAIRRLLVRRLETMPGMRVVGEAAGQEHALGLIKLTRPDVVLTDLSLARGSGLGLVADLRGAGYAGRIAVLTAQCLDTYRGPCLNAGADAVHDKAGDLETLFAGLAGLAATGCGELDSRPAALPYCGHSGHSSHSGSSNSLRHTLTTDSPAL